MGIVGLAVLGTGAALGGGLPALTCAILGAVMLAATVLWPRWAAGPTLIAAALVAQVIVGEDRAWWRVWAAVLLLTVYLGASETAQTAAWRGGWRPAILPHLAPGATAVVGAGVILGCGALALHGTTVVSIALGLAAAAGAVLVALLHRVVSPRRGTR